ncbi:MAG: dynamin family protein, partial [Planctomycetota bacterium]|nr:dynamin family protein [Planctomycetota bacterium]
MIDPTPREPGGARDTLVRLDAGLRRDLDEVGVLRVVGSESARLDELRQDLSRQLERVQDAAVVCLVGSTGAGKSTLLNALVGREVAREGVDRPTTSAPVIYRPADADVSELVRGLPGVAPTVVSYDAADAASLGAFWRGQILIDAPDVNSVQTLHRELVGELARRSDVLVVTAHRQSIAELSAATFVDLFAGRRGMIFVLGRRDELTESSRVDLLDQLRVLARDRWQAGDAPVLAISARDGRADPAGGGLVELRAALGEIISRERLGGVRRQNAVGNVARIASLAAELSERSSRDFEGFETGLSSGAHRWVGGVVEAVDERLEVRRVDLQRMLWNDASKVWDGPGGYALRVGGLSALGLGAGAVVARRNPLLAAGIAAGSIAADRVRGAVREQRFESTSGLLPGSSEVEAIGRDAFADSRLAAEALFGDEARAAMTPTTEELDGEAARAVDEAWDRLVKVELPRVARRGVPRVLRWAIDLPVYGLAGFVLYRVVSGFARERYVGVDFIVSAAIIALAWLFVARLVVRLRLASMCSALLGGVRG